jgi:hypothetical protein
MVDGGRVSQGRQIQATQGQANELGLGIQEPIDGHQVGISTAEQQNGSGRLLHKRPCIGVA